MIRHRGTVPILAALMLAAVTPAQASALSELASCEEPLAKHPAGEEPVLCLYELARGTGPFHTEASARLEKLQAQDPGNPWPPLYIGHLRWRTLEPKALDEAETLYRRSADLAHWRRLADAEYFAHAAISRILRDSGRLEEGTAEMERALKIARASGSSRLLTEAAVLQARHWVAVGEMGRAYSALHQVRDAVESAGSPLLLSRYLLNLVNAAQQTGRFREAQQTCRRLIEHAARHGDRGMVASGRYLIATIRFEELTEMPTARGRGELLELAQQALDSARAAENPSVEARVLYLLGLLADRAAALSYLARCFDVATIPQERSFCHSALARRLATTEPELAATEIQEALRQARESGDKLSWTSAWRDRIRVSWALHSPDAAFVESETALDAIEAFRDQQEGSASQPGLFSTWAEDYYWLSGRLLAAGDLERAFGVIERMRARTLTDTLGIARRKSALSPALQAQRLDLFLDIAQVQRRLLQGGLSPPEWDRARDELERLEIQLEELQESAPGSPSDPSRPAFATLEQVRRSLAADEALLSFQIAPAHDLLGDFGGGSWLLVSTRSGTRVYPLPDRLELRPKVDAFLGMFEGRDGSEAAASAVLCRMLLERALADLPVEVERLVIVADDALHRLPFAALQPGEAAPPLVTRYQVSLAPSATLWLRAQREPPVAAKRLALVFAAPPPMNERTAQERAAVFLNAPSLGALPRAREEGRFVVDHLGGGSELLLGKDASEERLKRDGVNRFVMVHFATHSLTDDVEPDHSFIYLAPGSPRQDGLLQVREIVELDFRGRIVVLSSCESASGEILRGEGVMGLARAFFQARASTVVASLWKLRDDDGAALFDRFYEHIGEGMSMAAALQAAQRDRMADGAPAAAWAGVVVLGDGDQVPLPGGRKLLDRWQTLLLLGLATLVLLVAGMAWRRRVT